MTNWLTSVVRIAAARAELYLASRGQPVGLVEGIEFRGPAEAATMVVQALGQLNAYSVVAASRVRRGIHRIVWTDMPSSFRSSVCTAFIDFRQVRSPNSLSLLLLWFASTEEIRRRLGSGTIADPVRVRLSNAELRITSRFMRWQSIEQSWSPEQREELFAWLYDVMQAPDQGQRRKELQEELKQSLRAATGMSERGRRKG